MDTVSSTVVVARTQNGTVQKNDVLPAATPAAAFDSSLLQPPPPPPPSTPSAVGAICICISMLDCESSPWRS